LENSACASWARGGEGAVASRRAPKGHDQNPGEFHFFSTCGSRKWPNTPTCDSSVVPSQVAFLADLRLPQVETKSKKLIDMRLPQVN